MEILASHREIATDTHTAAAAGVPPRAPPFGGTLGGRAWSVRPKFVFFPAALDGPAPATRPTTGGRESAGPRLSSPHEGGGLLTIDAALTMALSPTTNAPLPSPEGRPRRCGRRFNSRDGGGAYHDPRRRARRGRRRRGTVRRGSIWWGGHVDPDMARAIDRAGGGPLAVTCAHIDSLPRPWRREWTWQPRVDAPPGRVTIKGHEWPRSFRSCRPYAQDTVSQTVFSSLSRAVVIKIDCLLSDGFH